MSKENNEMLRNQAKEVKHHVEELSNIINNKTNVEPWVVAKMERASTDLSDITHYLDGEKANYSTSVYADGGNVRVKYAVVDDNTDRIYVKSTDKEYIDKKLKEFQEIYPNDKLIIQRFENNYADGGVILSLKDKKYDITYTVRKSPTRDDRWEVVSSSPNWKKDDILEFVTEEDAIYDAKISAGVLKENDPEAYFMRNEYADGGKLSAETQEKIDKLQKVVDSAMIPENVKEKARLEIEKLMESEKGQQDFEQRELNKSVLKLVDSKRISNQEQFEQIVAEALQDANYHEQAFKFASKIDKSIKTKDDWYQSKRFVGNKTTREIGIQIAQMTSWNGDKITDALEFVLKMKGFHNLADALKEAMSVEDEYPNRIETLTKNQEFYIKEIATRTATDQRAVTEFVKDNGLTETETLALLQGLGMKKIASIDFVTALLGNKLYEQNIVAFAKSKEAFKYEPKKETPAITDDRLKGKNISDVSTYVPHRNIKEITFTHDGKNLTIPGSEIFDGIYVQNKTLGIKDKKTKQPKVARTQFEEETYEYAKGGEFKSGNSKIYKLRAEGLNDFLAFLQKGMYFRIKSFTVQPIGVPDIVVSFETDASLSEIKSILREIPDSHVMLETVKPINEYTGDRYADGGFVADRKRAEKQRMDEQMRRLRELRESKGSNLRKLQEKKYQDELRKRMMAEGGKLFSINPPIGRTKYSINTYDGKSTHKDGSEFIGLDSAKTKVAFNNLIKKYKADGYKEVPSVFNSLNKMADGGSVESEIANINNRIYNLQQMKEVANADEQDYFASQISKLEKEKTALLNKGDKPVETKKRGWFFKDGGQTPKKGDEIKSIKKGDRIKDKYGYEAEVYYADGEKIEAQYKSGATYTYRQKDFDNGEVRFLWSDRNIYKDSNYEKGGQTAAQKKKIEKVMHEFKMGTLKSSSGDKVSDREQAIAIALSEVGLSKKADGGTAFTSDLNDPTIGGTMASSMAKGGSVSDLDFENSNLIFYGFGRDTNGNTLVKVGFPNQKAFSYQTNNPLFRNTYSLRTSKLSEITESDLAKIEKEVVSYLEQFGSAKQKSSLKKYSNLKSKGGWAHRK